jgi:hypothetical protein
LTTGVPPLLEIFVAARAKQGWSRFADGILSTSFLNMSVSLVFSLGQPAVGLVVDV